MSTPDQIQRNLSELQAEFDGLEASGEINGSATRLFQAMLLLLSTVVMLLVEKRTPKDSTNSGLPGSKTEVDETAAKPSVAGAKGKGQEHRHTDAENARLEQRVEISRVDTCGGCGRDLTEVKVTDHERRTLIDIQFVTEHHHVDAEIKHCPACQAETKGGFPDTMHGPLQYGTGVIAFAVHMLVSQMVAVRRTARLIHSISGTLISEATLLGWVMRLHTALEQWESVAIEQLLAMPVMQVDETSIRVNRTKHWIHTHSYGHVVVKKCHPKRGAQAVNDINIIPRYGAARNRDPNDEKGSGKSPVLVLVHDRWHTYFLYDNCLHALCGSHLLRDLQYVIDAHDHRWARRMQKQLCMVKNEVEKTHSKALSETRFKAVRKQYRTILTQGEKELPQLPERTGKRGRNPKTNAHNLHEAFRQFENEILRFAQNPHCPFTNNASERSVRMDKVKQKISGTFRSVKFAHAYCRISSYLQTMSFMGYGPLAAIQIALRNDAANILRNYVK